MATEEQAGRVLRLAIAAAAAVTAAFLGSSIGGAGTLIGTGLGAVISGAAAELYGHVAVQAKHQLRTGPAWRQWSWERPRVTPRLAAQLSGAALGVAVVAFGMVWLVETVTGRPLHAITSGSSERGSSFTGVAPYTPEPAQPAEASPAPAFFSPDPSATASPSGSLRPSVSVSPAVSSSPSVAPSAATANAPAGGPTATVTPSPSAPAPELQPSQAPVTTSSP